jgi:DNA topoisomerase-1
MPKPLVIVESPAKAKTIARFLGDDYLVESSIGHVRDLPRSAKEVPAAYKGESWANLGVDVDNDFKPLYVISSEKKDQVRKLRSLVADASELYLATDEDREGESIAWHLLEVLNPRVPVRRMVFHEITRPAIEQAIANPRDLDRRLVDAQEARRILDRLYGYELSPVLWKKVSAGLSAGRVQSVATRIVVERERERMAFRSASWWSLAASLASERDEQLVAGLASAGGKPVADGGAFDSRGELTDPAGVVLLDERGATDLAGALEQAEFRVESVDEKPYRRSPAAPFITSTLQQEAGRKLRFSSQRTMQVAQRLYEQGYITYMRTDSTTLSEQALAAAREQAVALYGADSVPARARHYDKRVKNAQEAHEAIRPAGERFRTPSQLAGELRGDEARLYELVWQRTLASQMNDATGVTARVRIASSTTRDSAVGPAGTPVVFAASGTVITSPGFLRVYREDDDRDDDDRNETDVRLPPLTPGERLALQGLEAEGHATKPPARFTEASLVKRLEELGVGRPSTYASILQTIQDRGYVWKRGSALVPSFTAFAVVNLLENHFPRLVDYNFTASMEDDLDEIAAGEEQAVPWLERFYFGASTSGTVNQGLKDAVAEHLGMIDAREVNSIPIGADEQGDVVVVRVGRYGPYLQRGEERAGVPDDLAPDELTVERALELLHAPTGDRELGTDPESGLPVLARAGRYGPYVQLGEAAGGTAKPRTSSLFKSMTLDTITLEQALALLNLPRTVGTDPATGEEIVARNGRYGPYLQRGSDSRSLESEDQLLEVSLDDALALFARPKERRFGRAAAAAPLREIGTDPETASPIVLRSGRFGFYVTDGTTNASLRRGDDPETLTVERAAELLADRRAAAPAARRSVRSSGARRAATGSSARAASAGRAAGTGATKTASTKAASKTAAGTKAAAKKAAAKKAAGTKAATKKAAGTKAAGTKAATKTAAAKKAAAKKAAATEAAATKATSSRAGVASDGAAPGGRVLDAPEA